MKIVVKYLGLIAEITGCNDEVFSVDLNSVSEFKQVLFEKYPDLKSKKFKIAQNQTIVADEANLTGEEIALLPPFAGG